MSSNKLDSHFNINKFSLKNKYDEMFNKSIDECAYYSIKSNNNLILPIDILLKI